MTEGDPVMAYVAADPAIPGGAWAMCIDDPRWAKYTARDIARWVSEGATIMRVTPDVAREMLKKWRQNQPDNSGDSK